ncbi:MAG: Zn-ribbon domain-containing OB-fold protein [Patescibacteria group bacterium]
MISPVKIWRNQKKIARLVGQTGKIISWTIVRVPPANFSEQAPYPVVVVALDNKERITAQLVDWQLQDLIPNRRVVTVIRRVIQPNTEGIIPYGIKVKPLA